MTGFSPHVAINRRGDNSVTLSPGAQHQIATLSRIQPETGPWLAILSAVLGEAADPFWDGVAANTKLQSERAPGISLLAGAEITLDRNRAERWVRRLLALAGEAGPEGISLRAASRGEDLEGLSFLAAAVNADAERLDAIASALSVDPDAVAAVAALAAMPLLQALRRRFGPGVDVRWTEGVCPICGGWPTIAELRGLERARRLRCGRCGGDWSQPGTRCPFCDAAGHETRAVLVSEQDGESRKVETCSSCRGYLKIVSTLRAWAADEVVLADLATIDLDLVAIERGYERPDARRLSPGVQLIADS